MKFIKWLGMKSYRQLWLEGKEEIACLEDECLALKRDNAILKETVKDRDYLIDRVLSEDREALRRTLETLGAVTSAQKTASAAAQFAPAPVAPPDPMEVLSRPAYSKRDMAIRRSDYNKALLDQDKYEKQKTHHDLVSRMTEQERRDMGVEYDGTFGTISDESRENN